MIRSLQLLYTLTFVKPRNRHRSFLGVCLLFLIQLPLTHLNAQCSDGYVQRTVPTTKSASYFFDTGIADGDNAAGTPDGSFTTLLNPDEYLILYLPETVSAGEDYTLVWRRKSTYTDVATARVFILEFDGTNYIQHPTLFTTSNKTNFVYTTITANTTTNYVAIYHGGRTQDDIDIDAMQITVSNTACYLDFDRDGIADVVDADDDNDGIADTSESIDDCNTAASLVFNNATAITGGYRFPGVMTGVDAKVTAIGSSNIVVNAFDNDGSNTDRWQPELRPAADGDFYIDYQVEFIDAIDDSPVTIENFVITAVDVDGTSSGVRERVAFKDYLGYVRGTKSDMDIGTVDGFTTFTGPTITYDGISLTDPTVMVSAAFLNKNIIVLRLGGLSGLTTNTRLFSLSGKSCDADLIPDPQFVGSDRLFARDKDGDGQPDHLDRDSDNDGLPDIIEAGGVDTDGNGVVDNINGSNQLTTDVDNDGLADAYDPINDNNSTALNSAITKPDTDGDGIDDYLDLDADNDGIPDIVEMGGVDADGDGKVDGLNANGTLTTDADADGFTDTYDPDDDNTAGIDSGEGTHPLAKTNSSGDWLDGDGNNPDTDSDSYPDHLDLDADNDGIPDLVEAGGVDTDGDGRVDTTTDADEDGYADIYDSDDDGSAGIEDSTDPLLLTAGTDTDGDGKADDAAIVYQNGNNRNADTDGDGYPDHLDLDADNDGIPDLIEAGGEDTDGDGRISTALAPWDADGDGLTDLYDENASDGPGGIGTNGTSLVKTLADTNSDGKATASGEGMTSGGGGTILVDADADSRPNHLDLDADNDGILDVREAGGTDTNGDGIFDGGNYGTNGYNNLVDPADGNTPLIVSATDGADADSRLEYSTGGATGAIADSDGDDVPDYLDVDSDNDGIYDNYEAQATASYIAPTGSDADGDGVDDAYDVNDAAFGATTNGTSGGLTPYDHDSDGTSDQLDTDSDNDNIPDIQEAWDNLVDGDSRVDNSVDCTTGDQDGDGLLDCFDGNDASATNFTWENDPPDDDGTGSDGKTASDGTLFASGSSLNDLLPNNGGNAAAEPDFRDQFDCSQPETYYALTENGNGTTTDYEYNGSQHVNGAASNTVRATAYCEPDGDGWYYFYNPLEPGQYLFSIRDNSGSANTQPLYDLIDYIEIKTVDDPADRYQIGPNNATLVLPRDWNVNFKQTPVSGSTFDVKFYFDPAEMDALKAKADEVEGNATGSTRNFSWFNTNDGLQNSDIQTTGVSGSSDISGNDPASINDSSADQLDGNIGDTGNAKNYVQFNGLSNLSGGSGAINFSYAALPVTLAYFSTRVEDCEVIIDWGSETEENFDRYELETSSDGVRYSPVQTVRGRGGIQPAQYTHRLKQSELIAYYRLRMIDLDGSEEFSDIIPAKIDCIAEEAMNLYPNPAGKDVQHLNLTVNSPVGPATFKMHNASGVMVRQFTFSMNEGQNFLRLDIGTLPSGMYFLSRENSRQVVRFVLQE